MNRLLLWTQKLAVVVKLLPEELVCHDKYMEDKLCSIDLSMSINIQLYACSQYVCKIYKNMFSNTYKIHSRICDLFILTLKDIYLWRECLLHH